MKFIKSQRGKAFNSPKFIGSIMKADYLTNGAFVKHRVHLLNILNYEKLLMLFVLFIPLFGFSQIKDFQPDSIPKNTQRAVLINNQGLKNALKFHAEINEKRNSTYVFFNNQLIIYDRFSDWPKLKTAPKVKVIKIKIPSLHF